VPKRGDTVELRLLGGVEVLAGGRVLPIDRPQQRRVLAALAVDAGRPVPVEALVERVWGSTPPPRVDRMLHTHLSRIRRLLRSANTAGGDAGEALVVRDATGYTLRVDLDSVDLHRFRTLVRQGLDSRRTAQERLALLRQGLDLWQGDALAGLPGDWFERVRQDCRRQRLHAVVAWAEAEVSVGNPQPVIESVTVLAAEHPLDEPLAAVLMHALHAAGRSAEALDWYARTQRQLAEQLGADPGERLQTLHRAILRNERLPGAGGSAAVVDATSSAVAGAARPHSATPQPRQLPPDVRGFAGRRADLAHLDAIATMAGDPTAALITAMSGTAGIGKTALAIHWAHRVVDRFPDGQLYVNLRGFDALGQPMSAAEAVRGFLDALGVPPERIPASVDAQAGLYRSLLYGRRILVVLDNASNADQVRALLPGAVTAMVIVTSRDQLTALVTALGARQLMVDLLSEEEARELLAQRVGHDRVAAEPAAVRKIVEACARLPLALSTVAARAQQTGFPLTDLAAELEEEGRRLDALDAGEPAGHVRAVFSWSYAALTVPAARLLRLWGLAPGPDISAAAVASLAGLPLRATRGLLAELAKANLIDERRANRYTCHDLLRLYAADLTASTDPEDERRAAQERLFDHYLHTAHRAALLYYPQRVLAIAAARRGVEPEQIADYAGADRWFSAELPSIIALIHQAERDGFDVHCWQLAWAISVYLDRQGHWQQHVELQRLAIKSAQRLADLMAQGLAHSSLGMAHARLGQHTDAYHHFQECLEIHQARGDLTRQAQAHINIGWVLEHLDQKREALTHAEQALELHRAAGDAAGEAHALNAVGWRLAQLGEYERARGYAEQAVPAQRATGNRHGEAGSWDSLGYIHQHLGNHSRADTCYQQAIDLYEDLGDRFLQADTIVHLAGNHRDAGRIEQAHQEWRRALAILDEMGHPDAEKIRSELLLNSE